MLKKIAGSKLTKIMVLSTEPVSKALHVIDSADARIAIVVNETMKPLGTITDGDVRRGLLKELGVEDPAIKS